MTDESQEQGAETDTDAAETPGKPIHASGVAALVRARAVKASQNPFDELPKAERERVKLLLSELTIGPMVDGGIRTVEGEDARRLVEIARICLQNDASIGAVLKEKQIPPAMIWRAAERFNLSMLSELDQRALNVLHAEFEALTANGPPPYLSKAQKARFSAYRTLLRMSRRWNQMKQIAMKLGRKPQTPVNWGKKYVRGKNLPDIVPDAYKEPEAKPVEPAVTAAVTSPAEEEGPDAATSEAPATSTAVALPSMTSELTPDKMQLLLKLIEQQHFIAEQLARLDPHDPRIAHYGVILHDTRLMMVALGLPLSGHSPEPSRVAEQNGSPKRMPLDEFVELVRNRVQSSPSSAPPTGPHQIQLRKTSDGVAIEIAESASGMMVLFGDMQPHIVQTMGKKE